MVTRDIDMVTEVTLVLRDHCIVAMIFLLQGLEGLKMAGLLPLSTFVTTPLWVRWIRLDSLSVENLGAVSEIWGGA